MAKYSFRAIHPANFVRFAPAALKIFLHPGGGVPILDGVSQGGGYAFFTGIFPEKYHPPPQPEILNSP